MSYTWSGVPSQSGQSAAAFVHREQELLPCYLNRLHAPPSTQFDLARTTHIMFALLNVPTTAAWVWLNMYHPGEVYDNSWCFARAYMHLWMDAADEEYPCKIKRKADDIRKQPSDAPGVLAKRGKPALPKLRLRVLRVPANQDDESDCSSSHVQGLWSHMSSYETSSGSDSEREI